MAASTSEAAPADTSHALADWQTALARARDAFAAWKQDLQRSVGPFQTPEDPSGPGLDDAITDAEAQLTAILDGLRVAHRKLMATYDTAVAGQPAEAVQRLEWQRAEQTRTLRTQEAQIGDEGQAIITAALAAAARALFEAATREWNQPRACRSCRTPIVVGAVWQPTTFTCEQCGEKTTFEPAPLTERFYDGSSLDAICSEHALDAWRELRTVQRRYDALRHPLPADFDTFLVAARTWAAAHADLYGELHPAWSAADVAEATEKRAQDAVGEAGSADAAAARDRFAAGSTVAAGGDLGKLMQWAQEHTSAEGMADLVAELSVCVHEHGDRTTAWQVIALQHHVQRVAQDRDTWMRGRLAELDSELRLR
jgi:hypothetical protein